MGGTAREVLLGLLGALLVLAVAVVLGFAYHLLAHFLRDDLRVWIPFLPGIVLGYLVGLSVRAWGRPLQRSHAVAGALLAAAACALLIVTRFHLDAHLLPAGKFAKNEWERLEVGARVQGSHSFEVAGTGDASHRGYRFRGGWVFWTIFAGELASILVVAEVTAWRGRRGRTLSAPPMGLS